MRPGNKTKSYFYLLLTILLICFYGLILPVSAAEDPKNPEDQQQSEDMVSESPSVSQSADIYQNLQESYTKTLESEREKLEALENRYENIKEERESLEAAFSKYQAMISTQTNMLLIPSVDLQSLEHAHTQQQVEIDNIKEQLEEFKDALTGYKERRAEIAEQIDFYRNQIADIKSQPPHVVSDRTLIDKLDALIEVFSTKQDIIDKLIEFNSHWAERYQLLKAELQNLLRKYEENIKQRQKRRILHQTVSPLVGILKGDLADNIKETVEKTDFMLSNRFWSKPSDITWDRYALFLATFLGLLVLVESILYVFSRYCGKMKQYCLDSSNFWQYLLWKLLQRSLLIGGAIAFIHYYPIRPIYRLTPGFVLFPLVERILLLFLAVQWGLVFFRSIRQKTRDPLVDRLCPAVRKLIFGILLYGIGAFIIGRLFCEECILLSTWRLVFEIAFLVWMAYFLKVFRKTAPESPLSEHEWFLRAKPVITGIGYALVAIGLVAELIGFGGFAAFWYVGLGRTALVLLGGLVLFGVLKELDVIAVTESSEPEDTLDGAPDEEKPYPVRWLVVRLLRLTLAFLLVFMLPIAWGAERTFLTELFYAINYRIEIGEIQLSVIGLAYAIILLLVIHTITVITKSVLRNKILEDRKLEPGLKESITRITGYGLWAIGILVMLRVIGISTTSLTVVFGAIGIGLGFGLQNIFNNFISGIILLFERPIQVGDVIEIDKMWGVVREINVRATHVRTYDNSDLIIPNSDFISQRLTNWSFRDARVRRKVRMGVAYGSDIQLVKDTLINIAYKHPRILRRPYPEVLFADFGESALIFELRFWCHIDYFLDVETDVRFDIDNQFRTLGIRIPFPQREVYIKEAASATHMGDLPPEEDVSREAPDSDTSKW